MGMRLRKGVLLRWSAWVLGLVVVVLLVHRLGGAAVMEAVARVGPRLGWLVAVYAAATTVMAFPWCLLLPRRARPSYRGVLAGRFAASGVNAVLPILGTGEIMRLMWLRRSRWTDGTAALAMDRVLFAIASALSLVAGAVATMLLPRLPRGFGWAALVLAALLGTLPSLAIWLAVRGKAGGALARLGVRLRRRLPALRLTPAGANVPPAPDLDQALSAQLTAPRGTLAGALALHVLGRGLASLEIYVALRVLGFHTSLATILVLAAVPVALSFVGALVPGQLGLQEGAQAAVAAALGLGATAGISLVLLQRIRQLVFVPVTAVLLSTAPHRRSSDPETVPQAYQPGQDE